jgi:hypothetical protein
MLPRNNLPHGYQMINSNPLVFARTGKITLRAGDYLIIKYPGPRYTALHGPQTQRVTLAQGLESAEAAKQACEAHKEHGNGR